MRRSPDCLRRACNHPARPALAVGACNHPGHYIYAAAGVAADALPVHQAIWLPEMGQGGLRWEASPHILTRESLDVAALLGLMGRVLGLGTHAAQVADVGRVVDVLRR